MSDITELTAYDQYDRDDVQTMYETFAHARSSCPVFRTNAEPGYWIVARYADAKKVLLDPSTFSNRDGVTIHGVGSIKPLPAASDPPLTQVYRDLLKPYFAREALQAVEEDLRAMARDVMGTWLSRGSVEFITEYAAPVAFKALFAVYLRGAGDQLASEFGPAADRIVQDSQPESYGHLMQLVAQFLEERRAAGVSYDDMVDGLEAAVIDGRPLSNDEKVGIVFSAVAAGFETNFATMALILELVARDPQLERRITGRDWADRHLAEFLRFVSPVTGLARTVACDATVGDATMREGEKVLIHYASANRDEEKFDGASTLDFDRGGSAQHMAFSFGLHRCIGAPFAEFVIAIALDELTKRVTDFRLVDEDITYTEGVVRRPTHLNLTFTAR
ncbi:MAG: cytochrome P450 [Actinomycetota bacterium]|nr:cytochrome P450 [Actinomycetota bacterium]